MADPSLQPSESSPMSTETSAVDESERIKPASAVAPPAPLKIDANTAAASTHDDDSSTPPAADIQSPSQWFNSYFGGDWVSKAKEQTMRTLKSVKKDIDEFSDTVTQETSAIANASAKAVRQQAEALQQLVSTPDATDAPPEVKLENTNFGWMKSVVNTVKSLALEDTAKGEEAITEAIPLSTRNSALDQFQLLELQNSEETFLKTSTHLDMYKDWLKDFRLTEYNGEINILLANNPKLREIYTELVPSQADNYSFWNRYFFKIYVAEIEKQLRANKGKLFELLNVDTNNAEATNSSKATDERKAEASASPAHTDNESWSVCSSGTADLVELPDEEGDVPVAPLTPKATDDDWDGWDQCKDEKRSA